MTTRIPVSTLQNEWTDAQRVDKSDLDTEQGHSNQMDAAIVQNFFGSGVLLETPEPLVLFDSQILDSTQAALLAAGNFDGTGLDVTTQPSDTSLGNQLSIQLSESDVFGRNSVKVAIIGLSFDGELQMERLEFHRDETQTTYRHYTRILTILFNDFQSNNNCSVYMGGHIVIREASPFELNRDAIMVAQDVQPDVFWRDFRVADDTKSLHTVIQEGIGSAYDADALNINITGRQPNRSIGPNDVTSQIGQKFKATTDNIQKVTLLMGVDAVGAFDSETRYDWSGDLVVSIYPLQTTVDCPTDIVPELSIEFEPDEQPVAEVSFSQAELRDIGYRLTDVAQPVDFVFTNTAIAAAGGIVKDRYYAVTFRRAGASASGTIFAETGNNWLSNSRLTTFGGVWVDVVEEDLWFQVSSDAAKYATGQAYDLGNGMVSPKTATDPTTGGTIDNFDRHLSFVNTGQTITNTGIIQAVSEESVTVQDERSGNNVYSRQQYAPSFSFITNSTLATLQQTSEPLILGCMADINPKVTASINKTQEYPGLAKCDKFTIINPDADLLSFRLIGRKLIPQQECSSFSYRIFKAQLCTDGYGDVNGDGYITTADVTRASQLIGKGLSNLTTQQEIVAGTVTTLELLRADVDGDGVVSANDVDLISRFVNRDINSFPVGTSFTHLELQIQPSVGRSDGYWNCGCTDGYDGYDGYCGQCYYISDGYTASGVTRYGSVSEVEREIHGNHLIPDIAGDNPVFNAVPYVPVNYEIQYQPFWQDWLLALAADARELPAAFTYPTSLTPTACALAMTFECTERATETPTCDPGRNDFYVPGNLVIGTGGVVRPDGTPVKQDIEIGIVNLELPRDPFDETSFDVFGDFVADKGDGFTNAEYQAMRYADCTTVQPEDMALNKIRYGVSIQSFVPNFDGYDVVDGYGIIVDDLIGVYMDHTNGILRLTVQDLDDNPLFKTLVSKIQIVVYLKKAGWNNNVLTVTPDETSNLAISSP